jgi:hypothetical protein
MALYLTIRGAARMKGCSPSTVCKAVKRGELTLHEIPTIGERRLSSREVRRWKPRPVGRPGHF